MGEVSSPFIGSLPVGVYRIRVALFLGQFPFLLQISTPDKFHAKADTQTLREGHILIHPLLGVLENDIVVTSVMTATEKQST